METLKGATQIAPFFLWEKGEFGWMGGWERAGGAGRIRMIAETG
jgi:hypothetical protein